MSERDGWIMPDSYGSTEDEVRAVTSSVGVCDLSSRGKVDIKGKEIDGLLATVFPGWTTNGPRDVAPVRDRPAIEQVAGLSPLYLCRLTVNHALMVSEVDSLGQSSPLDARFGPQPFTGKAYATNVTSNLAVLNLAGPASDMVLRKLVALDVSENGLPNMSCVEGELAKVHALLIREDATYSGARLRSFDIYFGREYAEYVWDAILDAGREFRIAPFGFGAHRAISGGRPLPGSDTVGKGGATG